MKRFCVVVLMFLSVSYLYGQGMYWKSTTDAMGKQHDEESYLMPKMFKIVRSGDTRMMGSVTIFRLDKELMWNINPEEKTYSEMTFADMEKMMKKSANKMDKQKEKMKNMPEEQRKMMEKMMGGDDQQVEIKKTTETKTLSGHKCVKYVVLRGEKEFMAMWIADDVKEFKPLMADWKNFSERISEMTGRFAKGMSDLYKKINGFPMETKISVMGQNITTTVTKIEKRSTPSTEFEIPSGFKKVKSPMEEQMENMGEEE